MKQQNQSQTSLESDQWEKSIDFLSIEQKVFKEDKGKIYIGGVLVSEQMRSLLRDQAKTFQTTNLFEIMNATIINEASNLLLQSGNMEHLQYGKALHYWNKILKKMINALSK